MIPTSFPQSVYSHVYFAFVNISPDTFQVIPAPQGDEALYQKLRMLRTRDLGQELWLSIGGWDFSDSYFPTATTFSDLLIGSPLHAAERLLRVFDPFHVHMGIQRG